MSFRASPLTPPSSVLYMSHARVSTIPVTSRRLGIVGVPSTGHHLNLLCAHSFLRCTPHRVTQRHRQAVGFRWLYPTPRYSAILKASGANRTAEAEDWAAAAAREWPADGGAVAAAAKAGRRGNKLDPKVESTWSQISSFDSGD
jgi:hypothetical protein